MDGYGHRLIVVTCVLPRQKKQNFTGKSTIKIFKKSWQQKIGWIKKRNANLYKSLYKSEVIYLNFKIENSEDLSDFSEIVKFAFLFVSLRGLGILLFLQ